MARKMTAKQINAWIDSLPRTTPIWATMCRDDVTSQQAEALDKRRITYRDAAKKLNRDLRRLDPKMCNAAESDAAENMPAELNDDMLGYWRVYFAHLASAAAVHWEDAGRDLNAELGYTAY